MIPQERSYASPFGAGEIVHQRFRIENVVGWGACSAFYRATDLESGRQVALHQYRPFGRLSEDAVSWFSRAAADLETMDVACVSAPFHAWVSEGGAHSGCWLAANYVPGATLEQERQDNDGTLSWQYVVDIGIMLAEDLVAMHQAPHALLLGAPRPQRIVLDARTGRTVLVAYGLDEYIENGSSGQRGFQPFEAILGRAEPRSDMYCASMIMRYLIIGRSPDELHNSVRREGGDLQRACRIVSSEASWRASAMPRKLGEILARAAAFNPADRYRDAKEFRSDLRALRGPELESGPYSSPLPDSTPIWERYGMSRLEWFLLPVRERNERTLRGAALEAEP